MASIYTNIRKVLEETLSGIVGLPLVAWENVHFEPVTGTSFIRPNFIPTNRTPAVRGLNPQQRYQGLFTVFCYVPESDGPSTADDLADSIMNAFEATTDIDDGTTFITISYAEREQGYTESPWHIVPVNIGWYIYN